MSLLKIGLTLGTIVAGLYYGLSQNPEKYAQLRALIPFASQPKETEVIVKNVKSHNPEKTKTTVYKMQGRHGEVMFSDERSITGTAHVRVMSDSKGLTLYTNAPDKKNE